jgi:uncharacterized protein (TIRG00374 family)
VLSTGPERSSADGDPRSSRPFSAKKLITRAVAVGVAGLALYIVLPFLTRVIGAWPRLSSLQPVWMLGVLLAESISFGCAFALQRLFLRARGWFVVVCAGVVGNSVTDVLPAGDAFGAGVQFEMLKKGGVQADSATGGLAASSMLGIGALLALPVFALPAILGGSPISAGLQRTALVGLIGFGVFAVCGFIVLATDQPLAILGRVAQRVWNALARPHPPVHGWDRRLLAERDSIKSALGQKWRQAVVLTTGRLGFDYLSLLFALRATGSDPRPSLVLLAYAATGIVALLPFTPGGLGLVEASLSSMLILAGVNPSSAFVATLAYRLGSYWLPLMAGPIAYLLFRRRYGTIAQPQRGEGKGEGEGEGEQKT